MYKRSPNYSYFVPFAVFLSYLCEAGLCVQLQSPIPDTVVTVCVYRWNVFLKQHELKCCRHISHEVRHFFVLLLSLSGFVWMLSCVSCVSCDELWLNSYVLCSQLYQLCLSTCVFSIHLCLNSCVFCIQLCLCSCVFCIQLCHLCLSSCVFSTQLCQLCAIE